MILNFGRVFGLPEEEQIRLNELQRIYRAHRSGNRLKDRYYEGKVTLGEVNLGIAIPSSISRLRVACSWGAKCVDVLASRSMFDGFVTSDGEGAELINKICEDNDFITEYQKACKEELKYGAVFAAVYGKKDEAKIRFFTPMTAAALWDSRENRIDCAFAFDDSDKDASDLEWSPSYVNYYTDQDTWVLEREGGRWFVNERYEHTFGIPMIIPMAWDATTSKPFGKSRIKGTVRSLIQGYIRTVANATIGLEFATAPQKYLLGVTDEQFEAVVDNKFQQYVGSILTSTSNPETGNNPVFGQLQQGNIQPHVEMIRILSTQFSATTGLSVTDTGVVNDANPTSSDAILAQTQTLVQMAGQLNEGNTKALKTIALMAMAIQLDTDFEGIDDQYRNAIPHFKNPSLPSVASTADAAIKIASAREGFSGTDVFLEMLGFSQADIRRIKAQEMRLRGEKILMEEFSDED